MDLSATCQNCHTSLSQLQHYLLHNHPETPATPHTKGRHSFPFHLAGFKSFFAMLELLDTSAAGPTKDTHKQAFLLAHKHIVIKINLKSLCSLLEPGVVMFCPTVEKFCLLNLLCQIHPFLQQNNILDMIRSKCGALQQNPCLRACITCH